MKRYIIYLLAVVSCLFAVTSCMDELVAEKGTQDDPLCYGVYFPSQSGTGEQQIGPDDPTSFTFKVRRKNTQGELYVPVNIKSSFEGIFTASEIYFEENSPEAELEVYFPTAKLGVTYDCSLVIEGDEFVSKYSGSPNFIDFNVTIVRWNKLVGEDGSTYGKWRDSALTELFMLSTDNAEQNIEIYERDDMPGYYRLYDVYNVNYVSNLFQANASSVCLEKNYTYIDATDPDKVWIKTFDLGLVLSSEYGMTSMASYVAENDDFDPSINSVYGKLEDGIITFPSGSISVKLALEGWYTLNSSGAHRVILPGYREVDDKVELIAGVSQNGSIPVEVKLGQDVETLKIVAFEGALNASTIAERAQLIINGDKSIKESDIIIVDKNKTLTYQFENTGQYTLVAVPYNEDGEAMTTASVVFGYLKDGDTKDFKLKAGLIASDKYAPQGMTSENSLELYINGEGITRLSAALYEKEKYENNKEIYWKNLELSRMTDASLSQINGEGLSLVQSGLVPGTEYILIIKASNGYVEKTVECFESTGGIWDFRLANYFTEDVDFDNLPTSPNDFCGEWNYYAIEAGDKGRVCHGQVNITDTGKREYNRPLLNATGFYPFIRKTYGVKDDSMTFTYYDGFIWSNKLGFDHFVYEGTYVYSEFMLLGSDGAAYSGVDGMIGTFVTKVDADGNPRPGAKSCVALMDSGEAALRGLDVTFSGFALLGFEDQSRQMFMGLLDLVESMVLVRPSDDPAPLYPEEEDEEDENEKMAALAKANVNMFNSYLRSPRLNFVEHSDGYMMSLVDRIHSRNMIKNYLDMDTAIAVPSRGMYVAKCKVN